MIIDALFGWPVRLVIATGKACQHFSVWLAEACLLHPSLCIALVGVSVALASYLERKYRVGRIATHLHDIKVRTFVNNALEHYPLYVVAFLVYFSGLFTTLAILFVETSHFPLALGTWLLYGGMYVLFMPALQPPADS